MNRNLVQRTPLKETYLTLGFFFFPLREICCYFFEMFLIIFFGNNSKKLDSQLIG
ncbi:hypothetical protein KKC1_18330 [Calderihabitans maritimus]|uniref:Uncharacterized protein n=1 Tax=Calderihabitans maritimus TaxID=1246530 RepID=A0A1Z5HT20_9FIRM|nr:hypothetical protein KKC1_18330 [Calderihabitans maritimus]